MVPATVVAVVLVEALRVGFALGFSSVLRILATFAEVTSSGTLQLAHMMSLALGQALALLALQHGGRRKRWSLWSVGALALIVFSLLQVAAVRAVAFEAPHLARLFWVNVAFFGLAAAYVLLMGWLAVPSFLPLVRKCVGAATVVGSLAAALLHYHVLVGLYPTLHSSVAMLAFLGGHLGLALLFAEVHWPWRRAIIVGVGPAVVLLGGLLAPASATARDRPYVRAHSALVRPAAIAETPEHLLRPSEPPSRRDEGPMRPDGDALDRFGRHSGLPSLPAEFDLSEHDVLLVFIDACRYDRTSLDDPALNTTPMLQKLVERGAHSFTRATSPANGTYPTLSSVFSMTTPSFADHELHARHWHGRLHDEQHTAPEIFAEAGYRTFYVGTNYKRVMTYRVHGVWQGFDASRQHLELVWPGRDLDVDARLATRAVREIRAARAAGERYFGVVFFISPHDDYQVHFPRRPSATPRDRYDQEIAYADAQLQRLIDEVERGGGLERTVIIVTGDHGEAFGEHGHRFHLSSLYSEQVHVPLVVWVPGSEGAVHQRPTSNLYVLPWLLSRGTPSARAAVEASLRSDLGPLMRETEGAVISEFLSRQRQHATLRYDDYTVYYDVMADFFRIFDAQEDPGELHDLREERPELVQRFTPLVQAYRRARFVGQRYHFAPPESWPPGPND